MKTSPLALRHALVAALLIALVASALALDPVQPPSDNFDLSHWKLTLPTGASGDPDEILPAQLASGYTSPYFSTSASDGALRFWAPVTGVTTGGSGFPRSELREQLVPGHNAPNWYAHGTHVLDAQARIVEVPSNGKVIIGQIHGKTAPGGEEANPLVKLSYDANSSTLRIQVKTSPHPDETSEWSHSVPGIAVGSLITYQIKVVNGVAYVTVNGTSVARSFYATDKDWTETDLYFKAGAYCLDNEGPSSEGALVDFYALKVTHSATADTPPIITTTSLPSATVGAAYSTTIGSTGGEGSLVWSIDSGSLPAGLMLQNARTATPSIAGTPTTPGSASFVLRVVDADGDSATQQLGLRVGAPGAGGPFRMSANQVVFEAEHASARSPGGGKNWTDVTQTGASGAESNNAIAALANTGASAGAPGPSSSRADYAIAVPPGSALSFYAFVRARGPTGSDDSIFLSVDGSTEVYQELATTRSLGWKASRRFSLSPGTHTLSVWMREDGTIIDKVVVSSSTTLPSGEGPAESPRD